MSITTFDYVPKIILGKTSNKTYNAINLVIRAVAFFIYFKTNTEIDILEIIIAYVFPIIYIFYKISQTNADYILGLFRLTGMGEKCIERRGANNEDKKPGNKKSISEDAKKCAEVDLSTINAESECNAVTSVGDPDDNRYPAGAQACLYIKEEEEDTATVRQRVNCSIYNRENTCKREKDNSNNDYCKWTSYGSRVNVTKCRSDIEASGILGGVSLVTEKSDCPASCRWTPGGDPPCSAAGSGDGGGARGVCLDNN